MASKTAEMMKNAQDAEIIDQRVGGIMPVDPFDPDSESTWDEWIESLKDSEHPGIVRAYRVPLDGDGNPSVARGSKQILLGSWPHQAFAMDELLAKIRVDFLKPGETAAIRLLGSVPGKRGNPFNKIVMLQRAASDSPIGTTSELVPLFNAFQAAQKQHTETMERLLAPRETTTGKPLSDSVKEWATILSPVLGPVLLAIINRPKPQSDIEGLIGALVKLKGLIGEGSSSESDDSIGGIIKAVAPEGLKLLTTLAANQRPIFPNPNPNPNPNAPRLRATRQQIPVRPTPPEKVPVVESSAVVTKENDHMLAQLKPQLDTLATLAEQGADPEEVAKLVMSTLPNNEEVDDMIFETVNDPVNFARLLILSPALAQHKEWCEKLRLALLAEYQPDVPPMAPTA